jgi:hypothetical protein
MTLDVLWLIVRARVLRGLPEASSGVQQTSGDLARAVT